MGYLEAFSNLMEPSILFILSLGVFGGIIIGSLPGLTATMGVSLLLPLTFKFEPLSSLILLMGIYIGAIYGGSIPAILLNTPGTPASAATALDGFLMAKRGEANRALGISVMSSFVGGIISVFFLMFLSPFISNFALSFSSPEYFALAVFGFSIIVGLTGKSILKGLIAASFGLLVSFIGLDKITGVSRYTGNILNLYNGFSFIPVLIGLFAMAQVLLMVEEGFGEAPKNINKTLGKSDLLDDFKKTYGVMIKSGIIGTFIGAIPGAGADIGSYIAYNEAKRSSKHPEAFGTGIPEGVAAPEAGNNGVTGGAFIPLLSLGIPGDATTAIILGAMMMQGLRPGPLLFQEQGLLVRTMFLGMIFANILMFIFGILGINFFSKVLLIPKKIMIPVITLFCIVGSYAIGNSLFDVWTMVGFGLLGYFFTKIDVPVPPIILALILGPMAESEFRRALIMSEGAMSIFVTRPISLILLIAAALSFLRAFFRQKHPDKSYC